MAFKHCNIYVWQGDRGVSTLNSLAGGLWHLNINLAGGSWRLNIK